MSIPDHPGAQYEPDLGPQTHLSVELPTHRLAHIAVLLDLVVDEAILHFEEDALRVEAVNRGETKIVLIEETSIEYTTDHHAFSVGIVTERFRKQTRIQNPDETTRLSFQADSDEATVHSGNLMDYVQLLDPDEVHQYDDGLPTFDWTYEGVVEAKALKQAIAGVVDPLSRDFHLLGKGQLGVRGKNPETGEYDRFEPVPTKNHPDGLGHVFLRARHASPVIDALPLDEEVTVRLGEWMPVQLETENGTTIVMAPSVTGDGHEDHLEAILEGVGIDA